MTIKNGYLMISPGAEVDQDEFKEILKKYGVMGRTDYEVIPGPDDGEITIIRLY